MKMTKTKTAVLTYGRRTARCKLIKFLVLAVTAALLFALFVCPVFAEDEDGGGGGGGAGDVAGAIEDTWNTAKGQVQSIVNNVVFPVIDMILAIMFSSSSERRTLTIGNTDSSNLPRRAFFSRV